MESFHLLGRLYLVRQQPCCQRWAGEQQKQVSQRPRSRENPAREERSPEPSATPPAAHPPVRAPHPALREGLRAEQGRRSPYPSASAFSCAQNCWMHSQFSSGTPGSVASSYAGEERKGFGVRSRGAGWERLNTGRSARGLFVKGRNGRQAAGRKRSPSTSA